MTAPDAAYFVDERDNLPIFIHQQLDDYGLDPYEFRIYARIARRAGKGEAWESLKNMAVGCRMSLGKLKEALRCLINRNLVTRESRPGSTSIYRLTPQRLWKTWDTYRPGSPDIHPPGSSDVYPPGSPGVHKVNPEEISPIEVTPIPPQPPQESSGEKRMHKFRKNRVRKQERPDSKKQERPDSKKQERPDSKKQKRPDSKKQERPDSNLITDVEVESVTQSQETSSLDSYQLSAAEIQEIQLSTGLPVYRHRRGPNGLNPEFVEYIRQWMLSFAEREVPVSDALSYITKREPGGSLATEWLTVLTKAKEWYRSLEVEDSPTEGQLLASEVAIALNSPYSGTVRDRFKQVAGKYRWEIAPGEPIPELVQWYTTKIKFSKRPEMTGKPPGVLARIDLGDRFLAAAIYEEWEAWAKALLGNHERKVEILAPSPEVVPVVDVTPHPVKAADALLSQDPEERIVKLQEVYDTSGVHKAIVRGWLNNNPEWELEIFEHRVQRKNARACIF